MGDLVSIPRNHTNRIAAIKATIVAARAYEQSTGEVVACDVDRAWAALADGKLTHDSEGKYTIHVHSNRWYHLYTADRIQRDAAQQAERDAARANRPTIVTETREQRHARILARTTSIHDLGKTTPDITPRTTNANAAQVGQRVYVRETSDVIVAGTVAAIEGNVIRVDGIDNTVRRVNLVYSADQIRAISGADSAEPTATDVVKAMGAKMAATVTVATARADEQPARVVSAGAWYLLPADGKRLTDRHDLLGPYTTESMAEHMRTTYAHAGIPAVVVQSATRPVLRGDAVDKWVTIGEVPRGDAANGWVTIGEVPRDKPVFTRPKALREQDTTSAPDDATALPTGMVADVDHAHRLALAWHMLVTLAANYGNTPEELGARAVDEPWGGLATMRRTSDGFDFTELGWASYRAREIIRAWDEAHQEDQERRAATRVTVEIAHREALAMNADRKVRWRRLPEPSDRAGLHPSEREALRLLNLKPTRELRELLAVPTLVQPSTENHDRVLGWIVRILQERFRDAADAAADVLVSAREARAAAGPNADPDAFEVDYLGEILIRIPFLARREHEARGGYGCLTAEDGGLPAAAERDEPGRRARCLCGRLWTLRESGGFLAWTPATTFGRDV